MNNKLLALITISVALVLYLSSCNGDNHDNKIQDPPVENEYSDNVRLNALNKAIADNPGVAENFFLRSKIFYDRAEYNRALLDIKNAIRLDSSKAEHFLMQGKICRRVPDISMGIGSLLRANLMGLKTPELYVALGEMQFILKQYDKAVMAFDEALKIAPYYAEAYLYKGLLFNELGDTAKAYSTLQTAIEQNPELIDAYNQLAIMNFNRKKYEVAKEYLNSGLRFAPNDPFLSYNTGLYYFYKNNYDTAANYFKKAVFFDSKMGAAHFNLGNIAVIKGNFQEASSHFENACQAEPENAEFRYNLAQAEINAGNNEAAINDLLKLSGSKNPYQERASKNLKALGYKAPVDTLKN